MILALINQIEIFDSYDGSSSFFSIQRLRAMDYRTNMNLATIFRSHEAKLGLEDSNPKEGLLEHKAFKVESRANVFLVDKRYALQLDELI